MTTWSAEVRSPDGLWLATARNRQWSGPGNDYDATTVYLKWLKGSQPTTEVLDFSVGNEMSQTGTLNLTMKWPTPSHFDVTYNGRAATLDFQVIKMAGISISAEDVSSESANKDSK